MRVSGLEAFQARALRLGFPCTPDSDWGPQTEAAFDQVFRLAEKAKGIVPPRYAGLPPRYAWVGDLAPLPLTIHEGLKLLGTVEVAGKASSPVLLSWAKEGGLERVYGTDAVPWCGLFVDKVCREAAKDGVDAPLWARNWLKFGKAVDDPGLGDVLVFSRGSGGHVAFYIGEDSAYYHVLGGNQGDAVTIMRIAKSRLLGARRPFYRAQPATVKAYEVDASGRVSSNES